MPCGLPKEAAPRISPQRPAEEREQQQGRFRDAVLPAPRLGLVQPERRKGDEVDRDEGDGDVGDEVVAYHCTVADYFGGTCTVSKHVYNAYNLNYIDIQEVSRSEYHASPINSRTKIYTNFEMM